MLDLSYLNGGVDSKTSTFLGSSSTTTTTTSWQTWVKPRGISMVHILFISNGGRGSAGTIGVAGSAGGVGGASGSIGSILIPSLLLPDTIYILIKGDGPYVSGQTSAVTVSPSTATTNYIVGCTTAFNNTAATIPTFGMFQNFALMALAGVAGGAVATVVTPYGTGLMVSAGSAGGACGAAATIGANASAIAASGIIPSSLGGVGGSSATTPPANGTHGYQPIQGMLKFIGGTGGGGTHGSATTTGLVQASGGNGAIGCGGGGSGGALTGSTAGSVGLGGPGLVIITCW